MFPYSMLFRIHEELPHKREISRTTPKCRVLGSLMNAACDDCVIESWDVEQGQKSVCTVFGVSRLRMITV